MIINHHLLQRAFLPASDPVREFSSDFAELTLLDELGHDLPSRLMSSHFRDDIREMKMPAWPQVPLDAETIPYLRLYYLRMGFLASAYINQVGEPPVTLLPRNIAIPFSRACELLNRPSILSYDGYALYNWKRFDSSKPIALGNIDTIQNFVHLYDEHWFILVHVEIEAIARRITAAIQNIMDALAQDHVSQINLELREIAAAIWQQVAVLRRIPEKMSPELYFKTFRPYIRQFEHVVFEGVDDRPFTFRGETGAQSSIMPTLIALMKIEHQANDLTNHLLDMRQFMPAEHRALIASVEELPSLRHISCRDEFNEVLEAMAVFREVHYGWAIDYISRRCDDPRGTGGTPYIQWLQQLIDETRAHMLGKQVTSGRSLR